MNEDQLRLILEEFVRDVTDLLKSLPKPETLPASIGPEQLTKRALLELIDHEGIVLEAYKDSKNIWTWGIGVTDASGHKVGRYKDAPQTVGRVVEVFKWLVEQRYLPAVLQAFTEPLNEHQLAAALSFHYNTGAIKRASWVKSFNKGDISRSRKEFMNWVSPKEVTARRLKERDLFFDGRWSNDGLVRIYPVAKPSYKPVYAKGKTVDIRKDL